MYSFLLEIKIKLTVTPGKLRCPVYELRILHERDKYIRHCSTCASQQVHDFTVIATFEAQRLVFCTTRTFRGTAILYLHKGAIMG